MRLAFVRRVSHPAHASTFMVARRPSGTSVLQGPILFYLGALFLSCGSFGCVNIWDIHVKHLGAHAFRERDGSGTARLKPVARVR